MKTVNVKAYSINDVRKESPFQLIKNATTMWRKAGSPVEGEDLVKFMKEYLEKTTKNAIGQGCYIVTDPATPDSRDNPYKIYNIPTEGKRKFKRVYELVNSNTNQIVGSAYSKEGALKLAKEVVTEQKEALGVGVKHVCRVANVVVEGQAEAFTFEYSPSMNAKQGSFLLFGIDANTIR